MNISSFISASLFYLLPLVIGKGVYLSLFKDKKVPLPAVSYFILGGLNIYVWTLILKYVILAVFPFLSFISIFKFLLAGMVILSLIAIFSSRDEEEKDKIKIPFYPLFLSLILSMTVYYIWSYKSPYPLNWDLYEHQTLANLIKGGSFSFFNSQISDSFTFNGYSSMFHTLLASSQLAFTTDVAGFWSGITFIHLFLVTLASFYLAKEVTGNENVAAISAVIGAFVFESKVVYTSLFFIPQTFTGLICIFLLAQIFKSVRSNRIPAPALYYLSSIFILLNHYIVGLVSVVLLTGVYVYFSHQKKISSFLSKFPLWEVLLLFFIFMALFSSFLSLGFINKGEAQFYNFDIVEKFGFMRNAYGYSLLLLLPLGMISGFKRNNILTKTALIITGILLSLVLLQYPYFLKFYVLTRYFVHLFMAIALWKLISFIKSAFLRELALFIFILSFIGIFITNCVYYKNILSYQDIFTHVSPSEIDAANFLKNKYAPGEVLLVSDPATQNIFETFSGLNTAGGAYSNDNVRNLIISLNGDKDSISVKNKLFAIKDKLEKDAPKRIFILSGRYFTWQDMAEADKHSYYNNVWAPIDLSFSTLKYLEQLKTNNGEFQIIYQNKTAAIVEAKNK